MTGIEEVARAAGVSTATVSRALSGRGRLSDATRARVRAAAADLGYVVSAAAATLASGRAENIGVVVPLLDRWFFATVLDGIASQLAPRGYDMTLYNLSADPAQRRVLFETGLRRGRVDGLIVLSVDLTADELRHLCELPIPVVGLGVPHAEIEGLRVDDTAVGRTATAHLLSLGHRDIVHLGRSVPGADDGALDIPTRRRRGFTQAMADAGIHSPRFVEADFTADGARRRALDLLTGPARPTAIFAASDEMAYGVLAAARELGIAVPRELSVIGVDGHELGGLLELTTIEQFPHAQGERAGRAVLAALGVEQVTAPTASLPFELVVRGSTAPPA
ncbi:LacI family DNA-binding transcriptional regulator [Microbacterium sp. VKM Ac-2870]|uniref:LacI family DNA-binding transcriptional regulator n=1 Tax=Microbacterium sp. VKM Ac-2870 TaxID=2783825 RepID=UPI00188D1504|nr:LacI family DNA-binding transcriptional regulator [Microbacterium sp. VKM Ac-2870]MBF4562491.1 LacI family DNA-binding transcriptional regulator [Microbacterium sp. VKM Ac-2870]